MTDMVVTTGEDVQSSSQSVTTIIEHFYRPPNQWCQSTEGKMSIPRTCDEQDREMWYLFLLTPSSSRVFQQLCL